MFKESILIYKGPNSFDTNFEDALLKKKSARATVDAFHNNKKKQKNSNDEDTDLEEEDKEEQSINNNVPSVEEDLTGITVLLKKQLSTSLDPTQRFIDYQGAERLLQELKFKRDPRQLAQVKSEISARQRNVTSLIQQFDENSILNIKGKSVSLFEDAITGGKNEKDNLINEFLGLNPEEQANKLEEVTQYLRKSTEQFKQLLQLVHGPNMDSEIVIFKKLDKNKRESYLKNALQIQQAYEKLLTTSKIDHKKMKERMKLFAEKGIEGKKLLLKHLQEALSPDNDSKIKEFEQANKTRTVKFPDFKILSPSEKETILRQIREEIKNEYIDKFRNHKYFYAASKNDIEFFESTFKEQKGRFSIQKGEASIKWLDASMENLRKIKLEEEKYPKEVLQHFNWANLKDYEKQELLKKGGKVEQYAEQQENILLDNEYKKRLTSYLEYKPIGLINQDGLKSYYEWFQNLDATKKQKIITEAVKNPKLDFLEETKNLRIATNAEFLKLPKSIQREYKSEYQESGFEERRKLITKINKLILSTETDLEAKLDEVIEKKLLSPKSRNRYLRDFKRCNINQRQEYLADCNLDKEHRQDVLDTFEDTILPLIPEEDVKKVENKFYNLDLRSREKYIKTLARKYKPKNKKEEEIVEAKIKAKKETKKIEKEGTINTKLSVVHKHFIKSAEKYEQTGDKESALKFYKEALEIEIEMPETDRLRIEAKITELKKEQEHYEKIQEGKFQEIIHSEADQLLANNPMLTQVQMHITMLEEAYQLQLTNERYYENATDTETSMSNSIEESYTLEANHAFTQYTDGQSFYVDQYGDLEVGEELQFDLTEYDNTANLPYWTDYFSNIQDLPKEARSDPRFQFINGKTGEKFSSKKFKQEHLDPQKDNFIQDQLAPELFQKLKIEDNDTLQAEVLGILKKRDYKRRLPKTQKDNLAA